MKHLFLLCWLLIATGIVFAQNGTISGKITKPNGTPISGAAVFLNDGAKRTITDVNGDVAADVNRTRGVTTLDYVQISRLIDGTDTAFASITSWVFIPAEFEMPPLGMLDTFPESADIQLVANADTVINFFGIKMGDVTGDASPVLDAANFITGNIRRDTNGDCLADTQELPFNRLIVKAIGANYTYFTTCKANGNFIIGVPDGNYRVEVQFPNAYWDLCTVPRNLSLVNGQDTAVNLVVTPTIDCPALELSLSTPFLRRCFDNTYSVQYCNTGTKAAENAYVEIALDRFLEFKSSSIPGRLVRDRVYRFDLGAVEVGVCQNFTFVAAVSCNAQLGQTHCVEADIYPNTSCATPNPAWDGASLEVEGSCENDSIKFRIHNVGNRMTAPTRSIVIEDDLVMMQRSIQLAAGATEVIAFAADGVTRYLQVTQSQGHPFSTFAGVAVEGCGTGTNGKVSYGYVNQYPQADEAPFKDIDCQDNRGSFDPNDKQAVPVGITENHYIEANTELEYKIRFQNTGTDTAFTVIIRDTLSENLNPTSIQPGASSHPYTYSLENNILTFLFSNIALPDSNVNEPASHGFVKFKIQQQPDLEDGTLIENRAGIYFDFNEPIITNTAWHQIGREYYNIISSVNNLSANIETNIAPNPFQEVARISLKTNEQIQGVFRLYDISGKLIRTEPFEDQQFDFYAKGLTPGFYSFEIIANQQRVSIGKLLIQR
ncbi:MAG: T9SS type A sorting domain-containing protein [Saprospiraceae bacterium]